MKQEITKLENKSLKGENEQKFKLEKVSLIEDTLVKLSADLQTTQFYIEKY